jgi:hypothetical protein
MICYLVSSVVPMMGSRVIMVHRESQISSKCFFHDIVFFISDVSYFHKKNIYIYIYMVVSTIVYLIKLERRHQKTWEWEGYMEKYMNFIHKIIVGRLSCRKK